MDQDIDAKSFTLSKPSKWQYAEVKEILTKQHEISMQKEHA